MFMFDLIKYAKCHKTWSWSTFGPPRESRRVPMNGDIPCGERTDCIGGVIDHIGQELYEVTHAADREARRFEWVDIVILAMEGYLRDGGTPMGFALDLGQKQRINEQRKWPDWRQTDPGKAIQHIEGGPLAAELTRAPMTTLFPSSVFLQEADHDARRQDQSTGDETP